MSMIVLLMAACGEQASPESERPLWPVGFRVAEVDELPRGNWIEHWPYESVYAIASTAEGLEVSFSSSDGYVHPRVRLRLTPSGARAQASYGDCTSIWNGDSIAGTTCLTSDGKEATLQFELYEGGSEWVGKCLRGQVELGTAGLELARGWSEPASDERRHERFKYSPSFPDDKGTKAELEVLGTLDALGQRQGLWVVRQAGTGEPIVEAMWRDGLPHGIFRKQGHSTTLMVVGQFQEGFQEGQQVIWYRDGRRYVTEYRHGSPQASVSYDASGRTLGSPNSFGELFRGASARWERVTALHTRR